MKTAYIECALWASVICDGPEDNPGPMDGDPFDKHFSESDLADSTREQMAKDCDDFLAYCDEENIDYSEWDSEQLGHDFWLSRNGHGTGFWDRDMDSGNALHAAARTFGSCYLYVGDDGLIYC